MIIFELKLGKQILSYWALQIHNVSFFISTGRLSPRLSLAKEFFMDGEF